MPTQERSGDLRPRRGTAGREGVEQRVADARECLDQRHQRRYRLLGRMEPVPVYSQRITSPMGFSGWRGLPFTSRVGRFEDCRKKIVDKMDPPVKVTLYILGLGMKMRLIVNAALMLAVSAHQTGASAQDIARMLISRRAVSELATNGFENLGEMSPDMTQRILDVCRSLTIHSATDDVASRGVPAKFGY